MTSYSSVSVISVVMILIRKFGFMVVMWEDTLNGKLMRFHESIFVQRTEELVLLDIRITHIRFLRIDSCEVLSLKHVLQFEAEVAEESRQEEVGGSRLVVIVMLEDPKSVNSMEDIISRVAFINSLHFSAVKVVPEVVADYHRLIECGVEAFRSGQFSAVSEAEDVGVVLMLQRVRVDKDLPLRLLL